jgi:hypothetical protein
VFANIKHDEQSELVDLKLPSSLRIQPLAFDPNTYEIEEPIIYKNDVSTIGF